jgi:hypothetical protein
MYYLWTKLSSTLKTLISNGVRSAGPVHRYQKARAVRYVPVHEVDFWVHETVNNTAASERRTTVVRAEEVGCGHDGASSLLVFLSFCVFDSGGSASWYRYCTSSLVLSLAVSS